MSFSTDTTVVVTSDTLVVVNDGPAHTAVVQVAIPGPQGGMGPPGPPGADGAGLRVLDVLDTVADLPADADAGDAYLIAGHGWLFNGTSWKDMGLIQGPRGKDGQIRFTGNGPPPAVIVGSEPGDIYLDVITGDTYKLI